jgi:hypothetical protein
MVRPPVASRERVSGLENCPICGEPLWLTEEDVRPPDADRSDWYITAMLKPGCAPTADGFAERA